MMQNKIYPPAGLITILRRADIRTEKLYAAAEASDIFRLAA